MYNNKIISQLLPRGEAFYADVSEDLIVTTTYNLSLLEMRYGLLKPNVPNGISLELHVQTGHINQCNVKAQGYVDTIF